MDPRIGSNQHSHQQQQIGGPQKTFRGKPIQTGLTQPERSIWGTITHVLTAPIDFLRHKLSSKPYSSLTFSQAFPDGRLNAQTFGATMQKLGNAQRSGEDYSTQSSGIDEYLRDQFRAEGENGFERLAQFRHQVEDYQEKLQQDIENAKEGLSKLDQDLAAGNLSKLQDRLAGVNVVLESHERIVADELFIHMDEDDIFAMIPLENLIDQMPEDSDARDKLQDFINSFDPDDRPTISANLKTLEQVLGKNTDRNYYAFNGAQLLRAMPDDKVAHIMYQRFGGSPNGATLLAALPKGRRDSVQAHYVEIELMDPYGYRNGIDMAAQIAGKNDTKTIVHDANSTLLGSLSQRVIRLQFEQKADEARQDVHRHQANLSELQGKQNAIGKKWADRFMRQGNEFRIKGELSTKKTKAERALATIAGDDGKLAKAKANSLAKNDTVNVCKTKVQEAKDALGVNKHDTDKKEHLAMAEQALRIAENEAQEALNTYQLLNAEALSLQSEVAECDRQLEEFDLQTAALEASIREDLGIGEADDLNTAVNNFNADIKEQIVEAKENLQEAKEALAESETDLAETLEAIKGGKVTAFSHLDEDVIEHAYEVERADMLLGYIRLQLENGKSPQDIAAKEGLWEGFEDDGINEKLETIRNQLQSGNTEDVDWGTFREEVAANAEMLSAYKSLVQTVGELITNHLPEDQTEIFLNNIYRDLAITDEHLDNLEEVQKDAELAAKTIQEFEEEGVKMRKAADAANIAKQDVVINGEHLTPANMSRNMENLGAKAVKSRVAKRNGQVSKTDPKVNQAVHQAAGGNPQKLANINSIVVSELDQLGALIFGTHQANVQQQNLGGPESQSLKDLSKSEYNRLVGLESFHASVQDEAARIITGDNRVTVKTIESIDSPHELADILVNNPKFERNPASFARLIADIKGKDFAEDVLLAVGQKHISGINLSAAFDVLAELPDDLPEPPKVGNVEAYQVALRSIKGEPFRIMNDSFSQEMRALGGSNETAQKVADRLIKYGGLDAKKLTPEDIERRYGAFQEKVEDYRSKLEEHIEGLRDLRDQGLEESGKVSPKLIREIGILERELEGVDKLLDGLYFAETGGMRRPLDTKVDIGAFNLKLGHWHPLTSEKFPYEMRRIVRKETSVTEIQGKLAKQIDGDQAMVLASKLEVYDRELEQMILKLEQLQIIQSEQGNPDPRIATAIEGYKQERQGLGIMRQAVNNLLPKEVDPSEIDMMEITIEEIDIEDESHNDRGRVISEPKVIALSGNYDPSQEPVLDLGGGSVQFQFMNEGLMSRIIIKESNIVDQLSNLYMNGVIDLNAQKIAHLGGHLVIEGDPRETLDKLRTYQAETKVHIDHLAESGGNVDPKLTATFYALDILIPMIEKRYDLAFAEDQDLDSAFGEIGEGFRDLTPTEAFVSAVKFDIIETPTILDVDLDDEDFDDIDVPIYNLEPGIIIIDYEDITSENFWEALYDLEDPTSVQLDLNASKTGVTGDQVLQEIARIREETNEYLTSLENDEVELEHSIEEEIEGVKSALEKLDILEEAIQEEIRIANLAESERKEHFANKLTAQAKIYASSIRNQNQSESI